jgi:hypothetical protein
LTSPTPYCGLPGHPVQQAPDPEMLWAEASIGAVHRRVGAAGGVDASAMQSERQRSKAERRARSKTQFCQIDLTVVRGQVPVFVQSNP